MKGFTIIFARVIYAITWFYLAPIIPYLSSSLSFPISFSGLVPFSFFVGSGSMQIPSAYISSRIGLRRTMILGLSVMAISSLFVGNSTNLYMLLISYFIAGVGASMFFSSGASILAILNEKRTSTALGIYNSAFSLGGIIGLNWIFLDQHIGFKFSSYLLSALLFISIFINLRLPNHFPNWSTIKDKKILYLGIATSGVWGAYYVIGELFPTFATVNLHIQITQSSAITSTLLIFSLIGGLLAFLGDRGNRVKLLLITSILGVIPSLLLYTRYYFLGIVTIGIFNELAISILYALAASNRGSNAGIALAEINAVNIILGSIIQPIASLSGIYIWVISTILGIIPLVIITKIKQLA
ncbi:MFS transporter [Candidatus Acidianus copahuensis]|uniref:MFS transporter n=1 Tax=Candidatus Acidianus copahuensis TaxID=1160895 RepID=A0A031LME4_9CREN|nr:MFS transporter [Candidatus Acidianus copahuensis]NON62312.1 MFS transporter [Acidianus sp. RZ1]